MPDTEGAGAAAGLLAGLGVAPQADSAAPATPAELLLEEYRCYLLAEPGVQAEVARGYLDLVRPFVAHHAAAGAAGLGRLSAADVTGFLTAQSRRLVPKTAQRLATALRSLLRFWHLQGLTSGPLDRAVPKVANRRPGLPRPLEPAQVRAMLASCDRGTAAGRCAELNATRDLAREFAGMLCHRRGERLEAWASRAETGPVSELRGFSKGLRNDWAAVTAGLTVSYSSGAVQGHVNRMIKRQMYGRAKPDLLRKRVLLAD